MSQSKPIVCSNCGHEMIQVDLGNVPAEEITGFVNKPGNKLSDDWYWCLKCDSYDQHPIQTKPSPETEQLEQELQSMMGNWWL